MSDAIELQASTESAFKKVYLIKATQSFRNTRQKRCICHDIPFTYKLNKDQTISL